jgi:DNA-binding CsgD family transcriptional regulator
VVAGLMARLRALGRVPLVRSSFTMSARDDPDDAASVGGWLGTRAGVVIVAEGSAPSAFARVVGRFAHEAGAFVLRIRSHPLTDPDDMEDFATIDREETIKPEFAEALEALLTSGRWESFQQSPTQHPRRQSESPLDAREVNVLRLLAGGLDTADVAQTLFYSERTVKNVISTTVQKMGARNRVQAVAMASRQGLF